MSSVALIPVVLGVIGLLAALVVYRSVLAYSPGTGKVTEIGEQIHKGALVFMRREYSYLAIFVIVVGAGIFISDLGWVNDCRFFRRRARFSVSGVYRHVHRHPGKCPDDHRGGRKWGTRCADRGILRRLDHGPHRSGHGITGSRHPVPCLWR